MAERAVVDYNGHSPDIECGSLKIIHAGRVAAMLLGLYSCD